MDAKRYLAISFFVLSTLFFFGCGNDVEGCMDPAATNYDPDATIDDGSCQYANAGGNAGLVLWVSPATAIRYADDNVFSIKFYVDGNLEGTHNLSVRDSVAPTCDAPNHLTIRKTVAAGATELIPCVWADGNDDTLAAGFFQFREGLCYPVEITY